MPAMQCSSCANVSTYVAICMYICQQVTVLAPADHIYIQFMAFAVLAKRVRNYQRPIIVPQKVRICINTDIGCSPDPLFPGLKAKRKISLATPCQIKPRRPSVRALVDFRVAPGQLISIQRSYVPLLTASTTFKQQTPREITRKINFAMIDC